MDNQPPTNIPDDLKESAALLAAGVAGNRAALEDLLVRHLPDLRAFVRLRIDPMLRAHESGSDLVQSVCREVLANPGRFEFKGETEFRSWLYGAVLHRIAAHREHYLAAKRRPPGPPLDNAAQMLSAVYTTRFDPAQAVAKKELVERLEQAFDVLSEDQREVVTLHRLVGLQHKEIAAQLGRTEDATRQLLHRALAQLAVALRSAG